VQQEKFRLQPLHATFTVEVVATDPECPSRIRQESTFLSESDPVSKICENRTWIRSHLSFSAAAGVCADLTLLNFGCIDGSRSLSNFKNDPDPDSQILEQERSRNLKMWRRPPLIYRWKNLKWFMHQRSALSLHRFNFFTNS